MMFNVKPPLERETITGLSASDCKTNKQTTVRKKNLKPINQTLMHPDNWLI